MFTIRTTSFAVIAVLLLIAPNVVISEVTVDPHGFALSVEEAGAADVELIINNSSEDDLAFNINYTLIEDDQGDWRGPRRDDPGDVLAQYQKPYNQIHGLAWDPDRNWMWGIGFDQHLHAMDLDNDREVVVDVQVQVQMAGMFYFDGILHIGGWGGGADNIFRWDAEGNALDRLVLPQNPGLSYIASDGEHILNNNFGNRQILVFNLDDQQNVGTIDFGQATGGNGAWSLEWVGAHRDGQLWLTGLDRLYQCTVDDEWNCELVQSFGIIRGSNSAIAHDGENLWVGKFDAPFNVVDDGVREFRMLTFDPDIGVVQGQDSFPIAIHVDAEGAEAGVYNLLIEIELFEPEVMRDDPDQSIIEISAVISVDSPTFNLSGIVADAAGGAAVEGVVIEMDNYMITRFSDEEGGYSIDDLPPGEYHLTYTTTDFLPFTLDVNLDGEDVVDADVALLHSQCNINIESIVDELDPGAQSQANFIVSNAGNGPLTYTTDRRLLGDANAEPWEHRVGVPAGVVTDDARVHGAVFLNDHFYASGANDGEAAIYVLNRDQELVEQYAQLGESRYGYKDLATDGEVIWGSGERIVFEFTPGGEEVSSFDSGISPCNNLTWDSDRDILWCSGTTTDIVGFDRDGNPVGVVDRQDKRIYGLAYWPDDPDGYPLYIYHKINGVGNLMVAKYDIENDQVMEVASLQHEIGGAAQGCFITNQYDIYSWVFMGVANSGAEDRVDIWQIDARKDWMAVNPTEGIIGAGEQEGFEVTLDATGLPEALFEGEVVFMHDGVGGETHLPITLQVGEDQGGGAEEMVLELANGWNTVSAYIQPDPDDIVEIMTELVEAETLIMVKNGAGQFYNPQFGFNNIPGWMVDEGYMIKMDGANELTLTGEPVQWDQAIALDPGWQMISYYPRQGVNAVLALSGIVDVLLMAKDGAGHFYSPAFGFSNMGDMVAGQGYLLKMDEAAELVYTVEEEVAAESTPIQLPRRLTIHPNTGENMSLLVFTDLQDGELGVYANDRFVGSGVIQNGKCGIAVWGDDPTTSGRDGALNGETLEFVFEDGTSPHPIMFETLFGENEYQTNDFLLIRIVDTPETPNEIGIVSAYPNPFNSNTTLTYNLVEESDISIGLFDLNGRMILELKNGSEKSGLHSLTIDGATMASGVYIIQLQTGLTTSKQKITLLR